jgi:hypothetical protein
LDGYVVVGTAVALVAIVYAGIKHRDLPELTGAVLVFFGANSATASVKIGRLLLINHVGVLNGHTYVKLDTGDLTFFLGGALGALFVGLVTFRDGVKKLTPASQAAASTPTG